ncbi:myc protein [Drosophila albomicans]|uniref:Myc protein n=1 Tax=Drosophila albomicans TaxID=7291 RepID=A0A6P8W261_DROAB|nr:myc protein [Drosophila albomicans]
MATMCFESMSGCDFPHDYEDSFADTLKMPPLDESLLLNDNDMVGFEDLVFVGRKEQSIRGDVAKIAAERSSWMLDDLHDIIDIKPDIRNGDCMWSSFGSANTCNNNSSSNNGCNGGNNSACNGGNSAASSYSESSAVPPAIVSCSGTMMIKHEMTEDDEDDVVDEDDNDNDDEEENCNSSNNSNNTSSNICSNKLTTFATSARITIRPNKSATQMRYNNNNTTSYSSNNNVEQHIPPGASLLRKSNPSTVVSATALKLKQQYHSLNRRSSPKESTFVFPDPPHQDNNKEDASMAPVFRHNVDLAACLVGSNNISLTSSSEPNYHIDHISRELQNGKSRFDLYHSNYQPQISDVLDVISQQVTADAAAISASSSSGSSASAAATTSTTMSPPASNSDCDSDDGDCSMVDSNCGSSSYMRHISDHSYTRSEMETNLETPSDSDEEIDVVSLNDKTLPTNPSDRDRRALQTKVANKISTIPPPRRGRYELPYTPASSSPVKSEANSRFPSPSSTPYQNSGAAVATVYSPLLLRNTSSGSSSSSSSSSSSAGSDCATSTMLWEGSSSSSINNKSSRKRYQDTCRSSGAFSKQLQASKKSRAKLSNNSVLSTAHPGAQLKQQQHTLGANSSSSSSSASSNSANSSNVNFSVMKRQFSLDEADTIEKRNLHNDMERQRRIGLKNLFEALKKQIPNIRDKERAPKVNILREAAKLCEQLTNEERELSLKRQLLKAQLKQRQEKIARLRLSMNAAE